MSVAVAHANSPHMPPSASSDPVSMDSNINGIKSEDQSKTDGAKAASQPDKGSATQTRANEADGKSVNDPIQSLAPPPRPAQPQQGGGENPDYFSQHKDTHFSREPNPFEQSFGVSSDSTPASKSLLPPVASLTSPAPLAGDGTSAGGYNYPNSLRSGPLSPAMLGGPVGASDYFDPSLRGTTFPSGVTPNESSLRTGLTPGGGGSMFPAPSPNSQALYQQLASGGATPSTLDFHRTAMNAAAASKGTSYKSNGGSTTQADEKRAPVAPMDPQLQNPVPQATFGQHDNDAANGLFMLAQATGSQSNNQFAVPNAANAPSQQARSNETSPTMTHALRNGSLTGSAQGQSEMSGDVSDSADQSKPATRSRGKKNTGGKANGAASGRRKAEETPVKQPSSKKAKTNASMIHDMDDMDSDEDQPNIKEEQYHENGKKMTDEEKRKNFLERNRVAALKCRQRKKQWLANLQAKVELFSTENDSLSAQVAALREEIVGLKTLLLQHKDCPVSQSQGLGGFFAQQEFNPHANPYGMGMQNGQQVMAGQRR